jgi:hypothetical protein
MPKDGVLGAHACGALPFEDEEDDEEEHEYELAD